MVVYALGALPGDAQILILRTALQDSAADVRWNAAVALARHGSHEGVSVLGQMLDRSYLEQTIKRDVRQDEDQDPIRSEEHTSELQSRPHLVCRLLLEKKKKQKQQPRKPREH